MKLRWFAGLLVLWCLQPVLVLGLEDVPITAEQWAAPRTGERVARLPGLRALLDVFDERAAVQIGIRYAGGDEGSLWAEEMRAWLVALGVPASRVVLHAAAVPRDELILSIERRGN